MFDDLPPFMTVRQVADVLQVSRTKGYELTVEWERSGGKSGLPFVRCGWQKRIPRQALIWFVERYWKPPET